MEQLCVNLRKVEQDQIAELMFLHCFSINVADSLLVPMLKSACLFERSNVLLLVSQHFNGVTLIDINGIVMYGNQGFRMSREHTRNMFSNVCFLNEPYKS